MTIRKEKQKETDLFFSVFCNGSKNRFPISMDYYDTTDGKARPCYIVGTNGYGIGIAATCGPQIFHPEKAAGGRILIGAKCDDGSEIFFVSYIPKLCEKYSFIHRQ